MARTILYLLAPLLHTFFWGAFLLSHYDFYVDSDPIMLTGDYQRLYASQRLQLLSAELFFPLFMSLFFFLLFFLRLRPYFIRLPLLLAQFLSVEFFVYRQFIFPDSYKGYQYSSNLNVPIEFHEQASYYIFLIPLALAFVFMLLIRERKDRPSRLKKLFRA